MRLRSKRDIQAAQRKRGQNLVVEDLQRLLGKARGGRGSSTRLQEEHDDHLEAFIEQLLCPTRNMWELKEQAATPKPDGGEALPPEVLSNISTLSAEYLAELQAHLARNGQFSASLLLMEEAAAAGRQDVLEKTSHKVFLRAAGEAHNTRAVLRFLHLLPAEYTDARTYNLAIKACSTAKDLHGALKVIDMMTIRQVVCDLMHFTTLITGEGVQGCTRIIVLVSHGGPSSRKGGGMLGGDRKGCRTGHHRAGCGTGYICGMCM